MIASHPPAIHPSQALVSPDVLPSGGRRPLQLSSDRTYRCGSASRVGAVCTAIASGAAVAFVADRSQARGKPRRPLRVAVAAAGPEFLGEGQFAIWTKPRTQVPALLKEWAAAAEDEKQQELFEALAEEEIPKEFRVWALATPSVAEGGTGLFLMEPAPPQALIYLEPADESSNSIHHILVEPKSQGAEINASIKAWAESLKPKKMIIQQPQELTLFNLVLTGREGATVSRGL
mmetsp:Transcript_68413/g.164227  ORF Transcript_68413/g.164227 Transcript_68413/m.164227 type:complete len:233 (-) Transcript_68413:77-775(-)|eukprot:CAMPEP_0178412438 /NCGR_PEP_ID=MMETSP0689_2-20121128/22015_1 /TAXON_ID=160604 /ORGANISM="Amphidinium massartii, Strain CS-259" /LENGTH=232 /DNA_ID=CAMNT_0020033685 /DNA_START=28 /DNA_END=726 /DNA_ORIENTATION=-